MGSGWPPDEHRTRLSLHCTCCQPRPGEQSWLLWAQSTRSSTKRSVWALLCRGTRNTSNSPNMDFLFTFQGIVTLEKFNVTSSGRESCSAPSSSLPSTGDTKAVLEFALPFLGTAFPHFRAAHVIALRVQHTRDAPINPSCCPPRAPLPPC